MANEKLDELIERIDNALEQLKLNLPEREVKAIGQLFKEALTRHTPPSEDK